MEIILSTRRSEPKSRTLFNFWVSLLHKERHHRTWFIESHGHTVRHAHPIDRFIFICRKIRRTKRVLKKLYNAAVVVVNGGKKLSNAKLILSMRWNNIICSRWRHCYCCDDFFFVCECVSNAALWTMAFHLYLGWYIIICIPISTSSTNTRTYTYL